MAKLKSKTRRWDPWEKTEVEVLGEKETVFYNNRYQVCVRRIYPYGNLPPVIHLSIKRNDRAPIHDWRDLQRIKNELVGSEIEMVEVYPRESQKVDTSNQFHLWGFESNQPMFSQMGIGWEQGRLIWNGKEPRPKIPGTENAVQRVNDEEENEGSKIITKL